MNKIQKEIIYFTLCILSLLGTILTFIFLQQYIPEYFTYINNNWNSGFTGIIQRGANSCKIPLLKDKSIKILKNTQKNFFNQDDINYYLDASNNVVKYPFNKIKFATLIHCLDNRTNYFENNFAEFDPKTNLSKCKIIDSFNHTLCENYSVNIMIDNTSKYTDIVFGQDQPCLDPRYYNFNITFNKTSYYYGRNKCPGGKTNKYYHLLYKLPLKSIIDFNNLDYLDKHLSDDIKNETINLYGRNYIGITSQCFKERKFNFKDLNNHINRDNDEIKSAIAWLGYTIIIEIIFFLLFINRFTTKYHNYINNDETKELLPPYTKPVLLIISLIMVGFHAFIFTKILSIEIIEVFEDLNCFEKEIGELIYPCIKFTKWARYIQRGTLIINAILAFKYGIKKGIKYAN